MLRKLWSGWLISLFGKDLREGIISFLFTIPGLSRPSANLWRTLSGFYQTWTPLGTGDTLGFLSLNWLLSRVVCSLSLYFGLHRYKPGQVSLEKDLVLPYVPNVDRCDAKCLFESAPLRNTLLFFRGRLKRNAVRFMPPLRCFINYVSHRLATGLLL